MERNVPAQSFFYRQLHYYLNFINYKNYRKRDNGLVCIGDKMKVITP